jgi:hypothetical protein
MMIKDGEREIARYQITIDPSKKPVTIDLLDEQKKDNMLGIYALDWDSLKICYRLDGKGGRPTEFMSPENSRTRVVFLMREVDAAELEKYYPTRPETSWKYEVLTGGVATYPITGRRGLR